jgi:collagen type VII alpha
VSTSTKAANAHTVVATGWTNPTNAYSLTGDNVYAVTTSTAKNTTISGDFGFPNFASGDIPDGSTINSVTIKGEWGFTAAITGATLGCQPRLDGANAGTEVTKTTTTEAAFSAPMTGVTLADLRAASTDIKARMRSSRGNTTNASEFRIDFLTLEVDYTAAPDPISGSGGVTITKPTLATTGKETFHATSAVAFDAPTLAAEGDEAMRGSGAVTFAAPNIAGDGDVGSAPITGTSAVAFGAPTLDGTALVRITGTSDTAIGAPVLAGTGTVRITGTGAVAISRPTLAADGTLGLAGSGGVTFAAPSLDGSGAVTEEGQIVGSGGVIFARPSLTGSGDVTGAPIIGSGGVTFGFTLSATGALRIVGSGGVTFAAPSLGGGTEEPLPMAQVRPLGMTITAGSAGLVADVAHVELEIT